MQLSYKQGIEVAEEQALKVLFEGNNYELTRKRFYRDLTVLGIGAVKTCFNTSEGATIEYVDPADLVYSYSKSPYYEDIYYVGEVKYIPLNELVRQFPHLSQKELEDISKNKSTVNPVNFFWKLMKINSSPESFMIRDNNFSIISCSPETLIDKKKNIISKNNH